MKIMSSSDKKKILKKLNEEFGVKELPYLFLKFGQDKLRIYSGDLDREDLIRLDKNFRVENIGLYFGRLEKNGDVKLSLEGEEVLEEQMKND